MTGKAQEAWSRGRFRGALTQRIAEKLKEALRTSLLGSTWSSRRRLLRKWWYGRCSTQTPQTRQQSASLGATPGSSANLCANAPRNPPFYHASCVTGARMLGEDPGQIPRCARDDGWRYRGCRLRRGGRVFLVTALFGGFLSCLPVASHRSLTVPPSKKRLVIGGWPLKR